MDMTIRDAKRDFERGLVKGFEVERCPMGEGWRVVIRSTFGSSEKRGFLMGWSGVEPREFKSSDAAIRAIEGLGGSVTRLSTV